MNNKEYILDTTRTLFQTLANMGVTYEEEDLTFDIIENHITEVVKNFTLSGVSKRFSEEQMIEASKYGYNYRDTTSFPNKNFDDNCKNNTRQWLTTLK